VLRKIKNVWNDVFINTIGYILQRLISKQQFAHNLNGNKTKAAKRRDLPSLHRPLWLIKFDNLVSDTPDGISTNTEYTPRIIHAQFSIFSIYKIFVTRNLSRNYCAAV